MKDYSKATKIGPTPRAERILIVGVEGVGKTTALALCPDRVILCAEDGLKGVDPKTGKPIFIEVPNYTPEDWQDALGYIDWLTVANHGFKTLCIDTLDWLENHAIKHICKRDGKESIEDYGYSKGQSVILPNEFRIFLSKLEQLQRAKNMMVVFSAHVQVKAFNNPAGDNYDRYESSGTKQVSSIVKQWCDVNLFATFDVATYKESKKGKAKGVGGDKRIVHTQYSAAWDAKNRCGLPAEMVFDMPTILEAIKKGTPDTPENIYQDCVDLAKKYLQGEHLTTSLKYIEDNKDNAINLSRSLNRLKYIASEQSQPEPEPEKQAA